MKTVAQRRPVARQAEPHIEHLEPRRLFSAVLTTLATFDGKTHGIYPNGLVSDAAGNLYGTTKDNYGPANEPPAEYGQGTVFEIAADSGTITTLYKFEGTGYVAPTDLIADAAGNLYGTATPRVDGSSIVFEIAAGSHKFSTLFKGEGVGSIALDAAGNLFGIYDPTVFPELSEAVFEIAAHSHTLTTIASADNELDGPVQFDEAGNLYAVDSFGQANGDGSIDEVSAGSQTVTTIATFDGGTGGANPLADLAFDSAGDVFGTTEVNEKFPSTTFEIAAGSHTVTTLEHVGLSNLATDAAGDLFGTVSTHVTDRVALVELSAGTHDYSVLTDFNGTNDASVGALTVDADGSLYGTVMTGFNGDDGTVFKFSTATHTLTTLASLEGAAGVLPSEALAHDADGNVYLYTAAGGNLKVATGSANYAGGGAVYEIGGRGFAVPTDPAIAVTAPESQMAVLRNSSSFALGAFTDAGANGPYVIDIDWGDGSGDAVFSQTKAGTIAAQTHDFIHTGHHTVTVRVASLWGISSTRATFVTVVTQSQEPARNNA